MKVQEIIDIIFTEEYYCIYNDDATKIVEIDKVENARENGTKYGNWEVLDIEIAHVDHKNNGKDGNANLCIMINCYNPKEDV